MPEKYDPNNRRKVVDMPTLSGIFLDNDPKPDSELSEDGSRAPFDPSSLDEVPAESHSAESNSNPERRTTKRKNA